MNTLVVDIGGSHVKVLRSGCTVAEVRRAVSGPGMGPREMVDAVNALVADWSFDAISIGYPGSVRDGVPAGEPWHLAGGWVGFDFGAAFGAPVRLVNDAAMQALGSYEGGRMLFLGLGTGLGSALVVDGTLVPLELAHLPYRKGRTYEEELGEAGRRKRGTRKWKRAVRDVAQRFYAAFVVDYVVIGGGNVARLDDLPSYCRRGDNDNAFLGGFRLWDRP